MKNRKSDNKKKYISRVIVTFLVIFMVGLLAFQDIARGGYLSTLLGETTGINLVKGKIRNQQSNMQKGMKTTQEKLRSKRENPRHINTRVSTDIQKPAGCNGKETIARDTYCGAPCAAGQRNVVVSYSDCDSLRRYCDNDPSCTKVIDTPAGCSGTEIRTAGDCGDGTANTRCGRGQLEVVVSYTGCDSLKRYCEDSPSCPR